MGETIKEQIDKCLEMADEIEKAGIIKDVMYTTFRENVRYELLKFLAYLADLDDYFTTTESSYTHSIFKI